MLIHPVVVERFQSGYAAIIAKNKGYALAKGLLCMCSMFFFSNNHIHNKVDKISFKRASRGEIRGELLSYVSCFIF